MIPGPKTLAREVPCVTYGLQDRVVLFAAAGDALDDDVGDAANQGRELHISGSGHGLQLLDPIRGGLGRSHQLSLLLALSRSNQLAKRLLLRAQRLELGDRRASSFVRAKNRVNDPFVLATGTLRGPDGIWLVTQELDIDHGPEPICAAHAASNPFPSVSRARREGDGSGHAGSTDWGVPWRIPS